MNDQRRQILEMLAAGKISADEAERLLAALDRDTAPPSEEASPAATSKKKPKFLHVQVKEGPDLRARRGDIPGDRILAVVILHAEMDRVGIQGVIRDIRGILT